MKMRLNHILPTLLALALVVGSTADSIAQKSKKKKKGEEATEAPKEKEKKEDLIADIAKKSMSFPGLFQMYQDSTSGEAFLVVREDQLDKEFIYFSHTIDGVLDARLIRGGYRGSRIFKIKRYFDHLEIQVENTRFYFDPENELSRASKANINDPIVFNAKIKAYNEGKTEFLIEADKLFLTEAFQQVKPSPPAKPQPNAFSLGSLSSDKTKYLAIRNYPKNSDVLVDYVFETKYPKNGGSDAVKDARSISVKLQHSLIEIPENNYQSRRDDPRMGFFSTQITDLTSVSATPYKDVIHRWHLEKKDPDADLSDPVEPIVFWIENTTPMELRDAITQGALQWNQAFESAGFTNAIEVRQQPDDAEWDAGDIRYNVIRWVSSPDPAYGGYGPSFVNPRTGQIIGADIMLEYIWVTYRLRDQKIYTGSSLEEWDGHDPHQFCQLGNFMQTELLFGRQVLKSFDVPDAEENKMLRESLYSLTLHEVGHTLGLMHNMMASNLRTVEEVHDRSLTEEKGLSASVMDYTPINVNKNLDAQGQYFETHSRALRSLGDRIWIFSGFE